MTQITQIVIALITTGGLITIAWMGKTIKREVKQVNRAVNHVPNGTPSLIQRVMTLEQTVDEIAAYGKRHREWTVNALTLIADDTGITLTPPEEQP
jgi:hypothetical protein